MKKKILSFLLSLLICISCLSIPNISTNAATSTNIIVFTNPTTTYNWSQIIPNTNNSFAAAIDISTPYGNMSILGTSNNNTGLSVTNTIGQNKTYRVDGLGSIGYGTAVYNLLNSKNYTNGYVIPLSNPNYCLYIPISVMDKINSKSYNLFRTVPYIPTSGLGNLNNADTTQVNNTKNVLNANNISKSLFVNSVCLANSNGYSSAISNDIAGQGTYSEQYNIDTTTLGDIIGHTVVNGNFTITSTSAIGLKFNCSVNINNLELRTVMRAVNTTVPVCNETSKTTCKYFIGEYENSKISNIPIMKNPNNHNKTTSYVKNADGTTHNIVVKCSRCNATISTTKENHSWDGGKVTKSPTCTEKGVKTYTCSKCKATKTEEIKALGHSWDSGIITKNPTCTEKGIKTYTCTTCKDTKTEDINALGHDYQTVVTNATCETDGEVANICTRCNDKKVISKLDKLGHKWDNGKVTKEATTTSEGVKTYTCTKCGTTKTESIPKKVEQTTEQKTEQTTEQKTTTEKKESTEIPPILTIKLDSDNLVDGYTSKVFTKDGIQYKVEINPDKSVSVYYWNTKAKKWETIPTEKKQNTTNTYNYTIVTNKDGTKVVVIKPNTKLAKVILTSFISSNKKKAVVTYQKVTNAKKYQVQISTDKKFKKKVKKYTTKKTIYKFKKLKSKKTYYVRVRAYKKIKGKTIYGKWSKVKKVKVR
ncbi:MAG: hypothetical protein VZS44_09535 [Bacilli bacterium]|nr:hypothetical protein [Bacilli bacterium]